MLKRVAVTFGLTSLILLVPIVSAQASMTAIWLGRDAAIVALKHRVWSNIAGGGGVLDGEASIRCVRQSALVLQCNWRQGAIAWTGDRYSICESTYRIALKRRHISLSLVPGTYDMCADAPFPDPS